MDEYAHQKDSEYHGQWWIIKNLGQDPEKTENWCEMCGQPEDSEDNEQ